MFFYFYFFFQFDYGNKILEFFYSRESIFSFFIGSISIFIIGLYDDKYNLKPNTKLFLLAFILMIVILVDNELVITDLYFKSFNYYTTLDNISVLFSVICFLLFLNAINMFDGINMQVAMYSFFVLFIIAISKLIFYYNSFF